MNIGLLLVNYILKYNLDRAKLEKHLKITHNKRDIFKSSLFTLKKKIIFIGLSRNLYIHIAQLKKQKVKKFKLLKIQFFNRIKRKLESIPQTISKIYIQIIKILIFTQSPIWWYVKTKKYKYH